MPMKKTKKICEACGNRYTPGQEKLEEHRPNCEIRLEAEDDIKAMNEGRPTKGSLETMKQRGGRWAAYQNKALDSHNAGHMQFLKVGEDCTYKEPPARYPIDNSHGMGWRYLFVGMVDLKTGLVTS